MGRLSGFSIAAMMYKGGATDADVVDFLLSSMAADEMPTENLSEIIKLIKTEAISEFSAQDKLGSGGKLVDDFVKAIKTMDFSPIAKTGISEFDEKFGGGFSRQQVTTIVAASGVGKTALALQIFEETMLMGNSALYLSTEMTQMGVLSRLFARHIDETPLMILRKTAEDKVKLAASMNYIKTLLHKTKSMISEPINTHAEAMEAMLYAINSGISVIIIDHAHNLRGKGELYERQSNLVHDVQEFAIHHNASMVLLGQMNKDDQVAGRLESASGKGSMEFIDVSDNFIMLQRPRIQNREKTLNLNEMSLHITKSRWGKTGSLAAHVSFPQNVIGQDIFYPGKKTFTNEKLVAEIL